jgi:4-amino-4-deoxy-L-arabinose transferase-like glycosyltransferase
MTPSADGGSRRTALWLGVLVSVGLALRVGYLVHATSQPGFHWDDPDSYMRHGQRLATGEGGWHFDFEAVEHRVEGGRYALPPLYPLFLSLFALFPGYPFNAQVAQAMIAGLSVALVFVLGKEIHSDRAGLLAAAVWAVWLPNVIAVWSTMQEALYVPLSLLAFVLLLRSRGRSGIALSGLVFGLAALTRSMPLYYLPVAMLLLVGRQGIKKGVLSSLALALGFSLFTVPYSVALSRHLGSPTFIENHGGLRVAAEAGARPGDRPPGLVATGVSIVRGFLEAPKVTVKDWWETLASILHVNGGRLLEIYLGADTKLGSVLWKLAANGLGDLLFVAVLLLAPFGLALCRRPAPALFLAGWVVLNLGLTVLSGFGGPRLRVPVEPHWVALAAVVLAGGWRRPARSSVVAAAAASLVLAWVVVPQLHRSFRARGDYGVQWPLDPPPKRSAMTGAAGFNVLAANGFVELAVRPRNPRGRTAVDVFLEGEAVERVMLETGERWIRHPWANLELVYVELRARDEASGEPVRLFVVVPSPGGREER